jgi:hypothetical protein
MLIGHPRGRSSGTPCEYSEYPICTPITPTCSSGIPAAGPCVPHVSTQSTPFVLRVPPRAHRGFSPAGPCVPSARNKALDDFRRLASAARNPPASRPEIWARHGSPCVRVRACVTACACAHAVGRGRPRLRAVAETAVGPPKPPIVLRPGSILYMPRGTAHHAVGQHSPSIHLTFSFHVMVTVHSLALLRGDMHRDRAQTATAGVCVCVFPRVLWAYRSTTGAGSWRSCSKHTRTAGRSGRVCRAAAASTPRTCCS